MVVQRYLTKADADQMIAQAEASNVMKALPTVPTTTVVEYYWAAKDQYFYTSNSAEIASLDASANWKRTGQSFKAFVSGSSQGQGTAVCRNYGTVRRRHRCPSLQRQRDGVHELHDGAAVQQLDARDRPARSKWRCRIP